jgi:hypothetical protein
MKKFKITFVDEIEARSEEDAYAMMVEYLKDCGRFEDVSAFNFKEIKKEKKKK